jgi:2'-5' RNA ligase
METGLLQHRTLQQVGLYEYLLVAHPDTGVAAQVMAEKAFFSERYQAQIAIKTKPHITVANFLAREAMEETIIRWMHRIISTQKKFRVTLDRFSGFAPHTIYLRIQDHLPFQQLAKELKVVDQYVRSNDCPALRLSTRPHLTLARQLTETVYHQAETVYAQKKFHASFEVDELLLLRRQHAFDSCKQINIFRLQP